MIKHMFVYGIIIPSVVTILVFIAFLVCWFKFNMRERFFKKIGKQQLCNAVPATTSPQSETKEIVQYTREGMDDRDSGRGSSNDPDGTGSTIANSHRSTNYDASEENSCGDDMEASLCVCNHSHDTHMMQGYSNPNLCVTPSEPCTPVQHDMLVQHTFHFPASECQNINCSAVDSEDGSEEGNYVPFVPITEAFQEPKAKHTACKHKDVEAGHAGICSDTAHHHNHHDHHNHQQDLHNHHIHQHGNCERFAPTV